LNQAPPHRGFEQQVKRWKGRAASAQASRSNASSPLNRAPPQRGSVQQSRKQESSSSVSTSVEVYCPNSPLNQAPPSRPSAATYNKVYGGKGRAGSALVSRPTVTTPGIKSRPARLPTTGSKAGDVEQRPHKRRDPLPQSRATRFKQQVESKQGRAGSAQASRSTALGLLESGTAPSRIRSTKLKGGKVGQRPHKRRDPLPHPA
jgi:hypothetical protein